MSPILTNYTKGQVAKLIRTILKMSQELTYRIWITLYKQVLIRADQPPPAAAVLLAEGEEAASTRAASTLLYSERKRGIESRAPVSTK